MAESLNEGEVRGIDFAGADLQKSLNDRCEGRGDSSFFDNVAVEDVGRCFWSPVVNDSGDGRAAGVVRPSLLAADAVDDLVCVVTWAPTVSSFL